MADDKFEEMSLIGHLTELRKRLMWSFFYILIIFIICFYFADELFAFLANPLVKLLDTEKGQGFIYNLGESTVILKGRPQLSLYNNKGNI